MRDSGAELRQAGALTVSCSSYGTAVIKVTVPNNPAIRLFIAASQVEPQPRVKFTVSADAGLLWSSTTWRIETLSDEPAGEPTSPQVLI